MITVKIRPLAVFYRGLGDTECNDPLGGIYTSKPYKARNCDRPNQGAIPQVRQFKNGDALYIVEGIEWMWYYSWRARVPSLLEPAALKIWEKYMRHNAAFTNLGGIDECRSWVLNRYPTKKPMKANGVDCPDENLYRATGDADIVSDVVWAPVWNLDYDWLVGNITKSNAREFALSLPPWLLHKANSIHPDGTVSGWDCGFSVPLFTSVGRAAIVDGFHVRANAMRRARLA